MTMMEKSLLSVPGLCLGMEQTQWEDRGKRKEQEGSVCILGEREKHSGDLVCSW